MKKLIVKTSLITLAVTLCALMITFGALALFAPKTVAGIFDGVGGYSASVFFYEKQYNKTGDINDLVVLVDKIDEDEEPLKAEKYIEILIEREDFKAYCEEQDKSKPAIATKEYYYGNYVLVLVENGRFDKALEVCSEQAHGSGKYTKDNPYRVIISEAADQLSLDNLKELRNKLNYEKYFQTGELLDMLKADVKELDTIIETKAAEQAE